MKHDNTRTPGGSERDKAETSDATAAGSSQATVGAVASRTDALVADRAADEKAEAGRTAAADKQATETQGRTATQTETQSEEATREQWLQALRDEHQALAQLSDTALERVLDQTSNLDNTRGQIVEELLTAELEKKKQELGDDCELLRGGTVKWQGQDITDGMIVRQSQEQADLYDVVVIAEAKAGQLSADQLREYETAFAKLGEQQRTELEAVAIDDLREQLRATAEDMKAGNWADSDQLRVTREAEIEARMKEIHGADMTGQVRKDFERLMEQADDADVEANLRAREGVTVTVNDEEVRLRASPATTQVLAAAPNDVDLQRTRDALAEQGIKVDRVDIGLKADEVRDLARELQEKQRLYEENRRDQ